MSTPNIFLPEVPAGSLQPGVTVNDCMQIIDALMIPGGIVEAIEDDPPVTDADDVGRRWIIGSSPSGVWAGRTDQIALCTAPTIWRYFGPQPDWLAFVRAVGTNYRYGGSGGWSPDAGDGVPEAPIDGTTYGRKDAGWVAVSSSLPPVVTESGTNLDADDTNAGNYTRFTNAGAKTYTFDDAESFEVDAEYHGRNAGTADLEIVEAGGMTINPPAGGTLFIPLGGTFTVKIVASDEADLFGVTVPV